jgi:hypothetical protein
MMTKILETNQWMHSTTESINSYSHYFDICIVFFENVLQTID